jgi:integrase
MRTGEVISLTWGMVDEKTRPGFIRLPADYVKDKKKRSILISPELRGVLDELKAEQSKVANISNRVFTRNGRPMKSIRSAFELAREKANITNLILHDFRHTCITRWEMAGIPREVVMAASGHASVEMHSRYVNVKDNHMIEFFGKMQTRCRQENPENRDGAVSG